MWSLAPRLTALFAFCFERKSSAGSFPASTTIDSVKSAHEKKKRIIFAKPRNQSHKTYCPRRWSKKVEQMKRTITAEQDAINKNWEAFESGTIFYDPFLKSPLMLHRLRDCYRSTDMVPATEEIIENGQKCKRCYDRADPLTLSLLTRRLQERSRTQKRQRMVIPLNEEKKCTLPVMDVGNCYDCVTNEGSIQAENVLSELKLSAPPCTEDIILNWFGNPRLSLGWPEVIAYAKKSDEHARVMSESVSMASPEWDVLYTYLQTAWQARRRNKLKDDWLRIRGSAFQTSVMGTETTAVQEATVNRGAGQRICKAFFGMVMLRAKHKNFPSMQEAWSDCKRRSKIWMVYFKYVTTKSFSIRALVHAFSLAYYTVQNFRPHLALTLLDSYLSSTEDTGLRILDPCAGYGGRLLGFWASRKFVDYVGIDPNSQLTDPYRGMIDFLTKIQTGKRATVIRTCAEEMDYQPNKLGLFDLIFTSPPYFDTEWYCEEPNQSFLRFPKLKCWVDNFLCKVIEKSVNVLKPGSGILALNIANHPSWEFDVISYLQEFVLNHCPRLSQLPTLQLSFGNFARLGTQQTQIRTEPCLRWRHQ